MYLTPAQRKIILLYARFLELSGPDPGKGKLWIERQDGRDASFVIHWADGTEEDVPIRALDRRRAEQVPKTDALEKLDKIVSRFFSGSDLGTQPLQDSRSQLSVFEFGRRIGFDAGHARYILDFEYASKLPTYSAVTLSDTEATNLVTSHGGLFWVYRHDHNEATKWNDKPHGIITRATLSMRYPVPYKPYDATKQGDSRVRCKMNIPSYANPGRRRIEYDGYVGTKRGWTQFLFQGRHEPNGSDDAEDLILMYAEPFDAAKDGIIRGVSLTQNQGNRLTPSINTIVIARAPGYQVVERERKVRQDGKKNASSTAPPYLAKYFHLADKDEHPVEERDFMHEQARIMSLLDTADWTSIDRIAVQALFDGWSELNIRGLHVGQIPGAPK